MTTGGDSVIRVVSSGRVDFSHNASIYDRRHGTLLSPESSQRLAAAASLEPGARVLDIGAGTGRVAIALASLGCRVVAVDPARPMLQELVKKTTSTIVACVVGEGSRLPVASNTADALVIARLLYLAPDWRDIVSESVRVLKRDGRLLREWSNGTDDEEWVQIRERIRGMFEREGIANPFHPGARSEGDVDAELRNHGMTVDGEVALGPGQLMTADLFVKRIVDGECSYTWTVPHDVAARCLPELARWTAERFDLTREVPMPREIVWRIYRKRSPAIDNLESEVR